MEIRYRITLSSFRQILFLPWTLCCPFAHAQLLNGSFENVDGSSWEGWSNIGWMTPLSSNDVPIGGGEWSISPPTENLQYNSGPQGLRQELPWLLNGDSIHLEAWLKSRSLGCNGGSRLGLGNVIGDTSWISFLVTDTAWTLVQYSGRVYITPGEVPYIYMGSHWPCGPNYHPHAGLIDAVSLWVVEPTAIPIFRPERWRVVFDASAGMVRLESSIPIDGSMQCSDANGRHVSVPMDRHNEYHIDLHITSLAAGLYFFQANTASGPMVARFVIP